MSSIDASDVNAITIMSNTINDCISKGTCFTAKLIVPFFKAILRTKVSDEYDYVHDLQGTSN